MSKHYDVAVIGAGLGALSAAVLLARRSWRVLVIEHGHKPWRYRHEGLPLGRRAFTLLAGQSPAWTRILIEVAQSQAFQRKARPVEPMAQVLGPKMRLDFVSDAGKFGREVEREFPSVRRVADDLLTDLTQTNVAADAAFNQDVLWPPAGFWEKRETARVMATLPRVDGRGDVLSELPQDHPFRKVAEAPATFASDLADGIPPFAFARLLGSWTRGVLELPAGEDDVAELLLERIRAHGGEVMPHERVRKLVTKGSRVVGLELEDGQGIGVQFVVGEMACSELLALAPDVSPSRRALSSMPTVRATKRRFVVTALVREEGLPELLTRDAFLLTEQGDLVVRLQKHEVSSPTTSERLCLLVAETLVTDGVQPRAWRERVLKVIESHLPFVERHYLLVDSPHDGRPLWDFRSGKRVEVERVLLRAGGASVEPEVMTPQLEVTPPQLGGLAGDALRAPLGNAFVVGRSAMPALGQEGELLSAWGVARIITRTDRRKEKMRREMWSKIELR